MDETRFDALTKALVAPRTRRRMLGILGSGALASVVTALADAAARAKGDATVTTEADRRRKNRQHKCLPSSRTKRCYLNPKKGSSKERYGCKKCCESFREVPEKPGSGKCCTPNGRPCESAAECCLGECSVGLCQNEVIQLPPPPCVEVGGACTQSAECCNGLPCSGALCQVPPPPGCAPFGQACTAAADCCPTQTGTPVPCSGGLCRFN